MHYKNGREAKNGDKVVVMTPDGNVAVGVLVDAVAGNDYCNGRLAQLTPPGYLNLKETLRLDDVLAAVKQMYPEVPPLDAPKAEAAPAMPADAAPTPK